MGLRVSGNPSGKIGDFATSHYRGGGKFPLKGGCPEGRGCLRAMDYRPWHGTAIFYGIPGVAGNQSLPCVKGGGVRKDTGGIDAEQLDKLCKIRLLHVQKSSSS